MSIYLVPLASLGCAWGAIGLLWPDFGLPFAPFGSHWGTLSSLWPSFGLIWPAFGVALVLFGFPWDPFGALNRESLALVEPYINEPMSHAKTAPTAGMKYYTVKYIAIAIQQTQNKISASDNRPTAQLASHGQRLDQKSSYIRHSSNIACMKHCSDPLFHMRRGLG